jgi:hypothetical protein
MAKAATQWTAADGTSTVEQTGGGSLLLESGGHLLLQGGGHLLLEDTTVTPKEATLWGVVAVPNATEWRAPDGSSTISDENTGIQRTAQDGTIRTLQDGTIRILEDAAVTPKPPTIWNDL